MKNTKTTFFIFMVEDPTRQFDISERSLCHQDLQLERFARKLQGDFCDLENQVKAVPHISVLTLIFLRWLSLISTNIGRYDGTINLSVSGRRQLTYKSF